ncbi:MAG: helix-turn-helix domain-containing protein [Gemmatimonadales bacterium]
MVDDHELRIKDRRRELGWSQEELGYRAKIDQSRLSKLERGVAAPTALELKRLLEAFSNAGSR